MGLFSKLKLLFSNPAEYFETATVTDALKLIYLVGIPVILLTIFLAPFFLGLLGALFAGIGFLYLIMFLILAPIAVSVTGVIYHLTVKLAGGTGFKKTVTIFGSGMAVSLVYSFAAFLTNTVPFLSILVWIIGIVHVVLTQFAGLRVAHEFSVGKCIFVIIATPIIWTIILFVLALLLGADVSIAGRAL